MKSNAVLARMGHSALRAIRGAERPATNRVLYDEWIQYLSSPRGIKHVIQLCDEADDKGVPDE